MFEIFSLRLFILCIAALILTYSIAELSSFKFHIFDDGYYSLFHFFGGVFTGMFFYSIFGRKDLAILLTIVIALLWELHEWLLWKYWFKKDIYKPKRNDTIMDIFWGTVGAVLILTLFFP